jgi:hypothetical protein
MSARWGSLAVNKFGQTVAAMFKSSEPGGGFVFLLPSLDTGSDLVTELLATVVPDLLPGLFPHAGADKWTRQPEYELPRVVALAVEIEAVEATARKEVATLHAAILAAREHEGYMHVLLTGQGAPLVAAVIAALEALGFNEVKDVDAEAEASGSKGPRREDIRILSDREPILGEVKGISGTPKEANALQVHKCIAPRQREWKRTDVRGLSIINHQRHLLGLARDSDNVFQDAVLTTADEQGLTLLTTFDLFRLVRGSKQNGWRHDDVADLFYRSGRLAPVPLHYRLIGEIDHYWDGPGAIAFDLTGESLSVGDTVAYELPVDFLEETVESVQLDGVDVERATPGERVGLKTGLDKAQARGGVRIFVVVRP